MKATLLDAKSTKKKLADLIASEAQFYWAVAWATETDLLQLLLKNRRKIKKLVIGTDFTQTHPAVLAALLPVKAAKMAKGGAGATFHPKVYCFVSDDYVKAIVGSANFTGGGMGRNEEACLLLEGNGHEEALRELVESVGEWWAKAKKIKEDFVRSYRLKWQANQKLRKIIEKPPQVFKSKADARHKDIAFMPWKTYFSSIKKVDSVNLDARLSVLDKARDIFLASRSFSGMDYLERSAIAGFIGKNQSIGTDLDDINWGWFGSMHGAGDFKHVINKNSAHISNALECIPMFGEITEEDYRRFVSHYKKAFRNAERKGGIATASRLLAMKRPDYFVCLDGRNKRGLSKSYGFPATTTDLDNYWERVIDPIRISEWWVAPRPSGKAGRVWDYRAAFLDAIFYE